MRTDRTRLIYMDIFRGIGIILMVMGHIGFGNVFDYFIHAFHMPMFFFVSGFFFTSKPSDEVCTLDFMKRKCKTLLVPYFIWGIFHYICANAIGCSTRGGVEPLLHLFFVNTEGLPIAGALWFLTALFFTNVIYFLLDRYVNNSVMRMVLVILIVLFGHIAPELFVCRLPYALDASFVGVGLFHIAYIIRKYINDKYVGKIFRMNKLLWLVCGIIVTLLIFMNGRIGMRLGEYAIIPLFWINAVTAIVLGINFSIYLYELDGKGNFILTYVIRELSYVGRNSMMYVVLNQFVIFMIRRLAYYIEPVILSPFFILLLSMVILHICNIILNMEKLKFTLGK